MEMRPEYAWTKGAERESRETIVMDRILNVLFWSKTGFKGLIKRKYSYIPVTRLRIREGN